MKKNPINLLIYILGMAAIFSVFMTILTKSFTGPRLQFWILVIGFTIGILYLFIDIVNGYRSALHEQGIIVYKASKKHEIPWESVDKNVMFDRFSFKFRANNIDFYIPLFLYKDRAETIAFISRKVGIGEQKAAGTSDDSEDSE
jgi:hypothetical protein